MAENATLTIDENVLYGMRREDLLRHGRAVQQYCDAADRDLHQFTVHVLMLSPQASRDELRRAAAAAGMVPRCREILTACDHCADLVRAYSETLRRRGL